MYGVVWEAHRGAHSRMVYMCMFLPLMCQTRGLQHALVHFTHIHIYMYICICNI